jgi:hypothetical protein
MMHPNWNKVDSSMARPLSKEQKLRPMLEILSELKEQYGRDPDPVRTLLIMGMGLEPSPDAPSGTVVPTNVQLEALKAVANYVRPKLQNIQVTGADEGPVKVDARIMARVGTDEELLRLADEFAITMAAEANSPGQEEDENESTDQ